ncbi:hypothetical protein B0O99DRAFT_350433 [Bisporella sp. PMI_857]|nr:hypothetical protein B0O99DRAFT_350433 [Bisporella sp. PMI_857]
MHLYYKTLVVHYKPEYDQAPYLQALQDLFPYYNLSRRAYMDGELLMDPISDAGFFIDTTTSWNTSVYLNPQEGIRPNFIFGIFSPVIAYGTAGWETQVLSTTQCTLSMKYYDVNVTCSQEGTRPTRGLCAATAMRQSPNQNFTAVQKYMNLTSLCEDVPTMNMTWKYLINEFPIALGNFGLGDPTLPSTAPWIELLLQNPNINDPDFQAPSGVLADMPPNGIFTQRFTLILNTWYISNTIGHRVLLGNTDQEDAYLVCPGASVSNQTIFSFVFSCANQTTKFKIPAHYTISFIWMVLFFIGDAVMVVASLVPLVFRRWRRGPDLLGSVASLTRDSPYFDAVERGPSTESGIDKALRMRQVRVKLGYVPSCEVDQLGVIVFAPASRTVSILQ